MLKINVLVDFSKAERLSIWPVIAAQNGVSLAVDDGRRYSG